MALKYPYAGEMTSKLEFFENITPISASGTVKKDSLNSLGRYSAKRIEGSPGTEEDGRLLDVSVITYQMRYHVNLFKAGGAMVVRDFDGDWEVVGSPRILTGRRRYMELKCKKRA